MSIQKLKQIFGNLDKCTAWSLQLLNARDVRGEFVYNTHDIIVTTSDIFVITRIC